MRFLVIHFITNRLIDCLTTNYLFGLPNPVKGECYHMGAIENVSVPTPTGDGGDLASVEADGHLVGDLWL